jgi:hypothetical protein
VLVTTSAHVQSESSAHEYEQLKAQVNKIKEVEVDIKNQLEEYEKGIKY